MDDPEDDPWNSPEVHKGHDHSNLNGAGLGRAAPNGRDGFLHAAVPSAGHQTPSSTAHGGRSGSSGDAMQGSDGWGYFGASNAALPGAAAAAAAASFHDTPGAHSISPGLANPFGVDGGSLDRTSGRHHGSSAAAAAVAVAAGGAAPSTVARATSGRTGSSLEENIVVTLMPGKEGIFLFQHHNYEVASQRRGSKVIRRYSDFVWLLDCLHKRYPFRTLPLLPPKRVAVNGNHLSNDGSFIEKRRRGLARFLNAVVRHPVLSQEQLVIMFLTVPTELSVWRKQATISVLDEFADKALPPGLEDSLPSTLEDLFSRTRSGVGRSAELYINVCNIMDRLVKRTEGVAADHARIAMTLTSLTETSAETYATDTNEVPLLNDGLTAMSKHLRTYQTLLEDESRGWDEGVLEDLKRQRDSLVSLRDLFERRDRLDKDRIPYLERRIQTNEAKLAGLRSKPEGAVKPGEIEKVAEAIIKDKESIVQQHNRSIFVRECLRDELVTFQSTQYHVSRWSQDWAGERVKYAEMLAENWRRLLDELEGMPLGE
ncbi:Sorting nexin mvp1 [Claviceps africana]|uniref:Sorting nexin MVP1 n=1 Tax=Claviceps africana TaxID=83212 RepID=A0A8K0NF44_9HYPO|nr:Sorting nexin mvp1 [Claviceps africana]